MPTPLTRNREPDLGPLLSSFERAGGGAPACMALPVPTARFTPAALELMPHQGQLVAAAAAGHRTFLLADEPGLGKTAQALLAAEAANAYPLLVVVPNVVKMNWAREVERWTPQRRATVIQGDGVELCHVASRRVPPSDTNLVGTGPDADAVLAVVRTWA